MKHGIFFTWIIILTVLKSLQAQDDITLFNYWQYYSDIKNSLYKYHCEDVFRQLESRKAEIGKLKTKQDWMERQAFVKEKLMKIVGPFHEKTPLNARVTGILSKDDYRIEKVIYESIPGYYVTGALYIPDGIREKVPGIFYACGHSVEGFRASIYQHIIINLVKKGFVVFTIDPMGQGERYEYWDNQEGKSRYPVPDHEHSYAGAQCLISGYSTARYFIWDVMRGIDYMLSRKEVDPSRLGITGRSGGGNLTAYLGALDDRIYASAPECYITNYEYLCKSIGPQCAEQNLFKMISEGLDHADFIEVRAPKPTMIISTTRDFFSIQGTRESYTEAKKMYEIMDSGDKLIMVEDDTVHRSTKKNREAMYAFFQKYLDNPGSSEDLVVEVPDIEELLVTKTGQVSTSLNGQSVFSLNKTIVYKEIADINNSRIDYIKHIQNIPTVAAKLSGFNLPEDFCKPVFSGRFRNPEYTLEKYLIPGSGNYMLPIAILKPKRISENELLMILDPDGMNHAINQDSLAHFLLTAGYSVLLLDLPGIGSMGPGYLKGDSYIDGISYNQWFTAVLAGKSHVGLRAEDIVRISHFIISNFDDYLSMSAIATGPLGSDLLHAAVFDTDIKNIYLINSFLSFENIATTRFYKPEYIPFTVAGAIGKYDLPDLMAAMKPRKILILNPNRADGIPASDSEIQDVLAFPLQVYSKEGFEGNFMVVNNIEYDKIHKELLLWLKK